MFDIMKHLVNLVDPANKPTLYLSDASRDKLARPVFAAARMSSFADIVFAGTRDGIRALALDAPDCAKHAREAGLSPSDFVDAVLSRVRIIDPAAAENADIVALYGKYAHQILGPKSGQSVEYYQDWARNPIAFSILASARNEMYEADGDCVLGGLTTTSRDFFVPCIRLHPRSRTVFTAAAFFFPDSPNPQCFLSDMAIIADISVVVDMSPERLAGIAEGTAKMAVDLFVPCPLDRVNVAMLSYSTRGSGEGPSVQLVRDAHQIVCTHRDADGDPRWKHISVTPELQFAPSVLEKAAAQKLDLADPINSAAGRSNVLIAPSLDVGNALFHLHTAYFMGASYILLPGGFKHHSAIDFSRSSRVDDIVMAAAAAACARIQKNRMVIPSLKEGGWQ